MTNDGRVLAALGVASVLVLPTREALAAGDQQALLDAIHVNAGATCVQATALAEQVGTWLGAETTDADVWVRVEGSPDDPRVASFEMGRGDHLLARRRFAPGPEQCEHLQAALGLAIALAIKVTLLDEILGPKENPERPTPIPQWPGALGGGALVASGVLPGVSLGAGVQAERTLPPNFALRLGLLGLVARDQTFGVSPGAFDAEIFALRFDVCARLDLTRGLVVRGCAGLMAGGLFTQGHDFASSRSASSGWSAAANALDVGLDLTDRWALTGELTLVLPLEHTRVGVLSATGDVVEARDLSSVGITLAVGPAYRF